MWTLSFQHPSSKVQGLLEGAVARFSEFQGEEYFLSMDFWRRIRCVCRWPIMLAVVFDRSIPCTMGVVAVDCVGESLFMPGVLPEDRVAMTRQLRFLDTVDAAMFHEIVNCEYGAVEMCDPPMQIRTVEEAASCGVTLTVDEGLTELARRDNLWWQKWGGNLYQLDIDLGREYPFGEYRLLQTDAGRYSRLPTYLLR